MNFWFYKKKFKKILGQVKILKCPHFLIPYSIDSQKKEP
jgi:hypothetical protein